MWRARTFTASSATAAGLFPFVAGSGAPAAGVMMGRHLIWGEPVHMDPFAWLASGLTTNTGIFQMGQPGTGKSAFAKRQILGLVQRGVKPVVVGDPKGEYSDLVARMGGQVLRIGPGRDRLNPLDAPAVGAEDPVETRRRRVWLLTALCALVRRQQPLRNAEEVMLALAVDTVTQGRGPATLTQVLTALRNPDERFTTAAGLRDRRALDDVTQELRWTLQLLVDGALGAVFDGPSTQSFDAHAPAVAVDLSHVHDETMLGAAMLSSWAWGQAAVRSARSQDDATMWLMVMDELWRTIRGGAGLVDHIDELTRLGRSRGIASLMITHSLSDLEAIPRRSDVAKAMGFIDRSAIVVLSGLPRRELQLVRQIVPLSDAEVDLVASWSSAHRWGPNHGHPGRGKYLIKTGNRPGLPVDMRLTAAEKELFDTDPRLSSQSYRAT